MTRIWISMAMLFGGVEFALSQPASPAPQPPAPTPAPAAGAPLLELTKACPDLRYVGRDAAFELRVTNRGSGPARDVVVEDVLDGTAQFVSADQGGTHQNGRVTWRVGTLEAGQSRTLRAVYKCDTIGVLRNTARATYCVELVTSCQVQVKGIPAILLECVDDPDPVAIGTNTTYTITVTNQGSAVGTNIAIECTLPAELEHVNSSGPTSGRLDGRRVVFQPIPSLAPKARATYKVTVKGVGEGDVRFGVQMNSDQIDQPVMETESTRVYR